MVYQKFELADGSHFVSDMQGYFEYILNKVTFRIKTGYYLDFLTPKTRKLPGSTKIKVTKDENSENVSHLKINKIIFTHFNNANKDYQHNSSVLYTIVRNKPLYFWSKIFIF